MHDFEGDCFEMHVHMRYRLWWWRFEFPADKRVQAAVLGRTGPSY